MSLRLLLVDESEVLRMGVRTLIRNKNGWQVCGEASNGIEAIIKVQEVAPDVVILALTMPVKNGFQTAAELRRIAPSVKIVFFSLHNCPATAREVGADAFVLKSSPAQELIAAIERVTGHPQSDRQTSGLSASSTTTNCQRESVK